MLIHLVYVFVSFIANIVGKFHRENFLPMFEADPKDKAALLPVGLCTQILGHVGGVSRNEGAFDDGWSSLGCFRTSGDDVLLWDVEL